MRKHKRLSLAVVGVAAASFIAPQAAVAENTSVSISRVARISSTGNSAFFRVTVVCARNTVAGVISARLLQRMPDGTWQANTDRTGVNQAVECTGKEESFWLGIRRPVGGESWQPGAASLRSFRFTTVETDGGRWRDRDSNSSSDDSTSTDDRPWAGAEGDDGTFGSDGSDDGNQSDDTETFVTTLRARTVILR